MKILRDTWYVAALSTEVGRTPFGRKVAGVSVVIYRREDGCVAAIDGICPHRFAPLHKGRLVGDAIECGYHGLRFGPDGRCIFNPQGDVISPSAHLRRYPVEERHGLIWIWVGDATLADCARIPDLALTQNSAATRTVYSYLEVPYRYDILIDNLVDLSHIDYLHVGSFSGGAPERGETRVEEFDDLVITTRRLFRAPAEPMSADIAEMVDKQFRITWSPSQTVLFESLTAEAGTPLEEGRPSTFGHIATPRDEKSTHYYMFVCRKYDLEDVELDALISQGQKHVIQTEDSPMLEAIAEQMNGADLLALRPVVLPDDIGALRVRRVMKRLLQAGPDAMEGGS